MQSSALKNVFGVLISFVLIMSSLAIIVVYAIQYTFTAQNMEQVFSSLNLGKTIQQNAAYEELVKNASKLNIQKETVDKILNTDAVTNVIGDCTSGIVLGLFEGKKPADSLEVALGHSMTNNSAELEQIMAETIDAGEQTAIHELEKKKNSGALTQAQFDEAVSKAKKASQEAKKSSKDSLTELSSKVKEQIIQNPSFASMNNYDVSKFTTLFNLLKITIIVCIIVLIILFLRNATSAFWLSVNCFIISIISFICQLILTSKSDTMCNVFYNKFKGSQIIAKISSSAFAQMITFLSAGLKKYALFIFIGGVVFLIVHILLKPFRTKLASNDGYYDNGYDDHYFDDNPY